MQWIAGRASGDGLDVVTSILNTVASPQLCRDMRLAPPCNPPLDVDNTYLTDDVRMLQTAFDYAANLASNVLWGQLLYHHTLPLAGASLLAGDEASIMFCHV